MTAPASPTSPSSSAMTPAIVWFRDDLRLADNPALAQAVENHSAVICVFIRGDALLQPPSLSGDCGTERERPMGAAARWWLHESLAALDQHLREKGSRLVLRTGDAADVLFALAKESGADAIYWNRRYGAAERASDADLKARLRTAGLAAESHNHALLYEPWTVKSKTGGPMRVFTPFWRAARAMAEPGRPLPAPPAIPSPQLPSEPLEDWALKPTNPDWASAFQTHWTPGEDGAEARLSLFTETALAGYGSDRDRPDIPSTSMLSPHLRFGEISPRTAFYAAEYARADDGPGRDIDKFQSELGWREFAYHLLFHNPTLADANYQAKFDAFPWRDAPEDLRAWQRGMTGYPLVDAGMRQLWQTGWMHNRVRMVAASFLIKHLMIHWRHGERWFWDTLVDADPANNPASWQWVAGSGADAAPYFRIFNPTSQGEKFDPEGTFIKAYVPELAKVPAKHIHNPSAAPSDILARAGVVLDEIYPRPIVEHHFARDRALAAFKALKSAA